MAERRFWLTEQDRDKMRTLFDRFAHLLGPRGGDRDDFDDYPAPDTYIARVGVGGIPALDLGADMGSGTGTGETGDDVPGSAVCAIYRITGTGASARISPMGFTRTVYNLQPSAIAYGRWVVVTRLKTGEWVAVNPPEAAAASGGGGSLEVEDTDESPSVASVTQLRFDSADGFVVSSPGSGVARVDMAAASLTQAGVVSTSAQEFNGPKTFDDGIISDADLVLTTNGAPTVNFNPAGGSLLGAITVVAVGGDGQMSISAVESGGAASDSRIVIDANVNKITLESFTTQVDAPTLLLGVTDAIQYDSASGSAFPTLTLTRASGAITVTGASGTIDLTTATSINVTSGWITGWS